MIQLDFYDVFKYFFLSLVWTSNFKSQILRFYFMKPVLVVFCVEFSLLLIYFMYLAFHM